ncbi:hypothetical protein DFH01_24960 [Falsiroseomonas bella]|uniref:Uncharacterized protein n=2 Tax=Falsiroseomonas bella TaxID=2184016 RepID=A0A317F6X2_9PROT|nr:hypothetical protein DFH01_24960 [Falsiroseomonas bella]
MLRILIGGAALLALPYAQTAFAEGFYPRVTGNGENVEIDYGPGPRGNIIGGGRVVVTGSGENMQIGHLDPQFAQQPVPGLVPVSVGSGENASVVWVAAGTSPWRLALIGGDGSLPAEGAATHNPLARLFGGAPDRG